MKPLTLKIPEWQLPEFPFRHSLEAIEKATVQLKEMTRKAGVGSTAFQQKIEELKRSSYHQSPIAEKLQNGRDIRAMVYLWLTNEHFLSRAQVSKSILQRFSKIKKKQSHLALYNLTQVFFKHFDKCGDFRSLALFLLAEYEKRPASAFDSELGKIQRNKEILFHAEAPHTLARKSIQESMDLQLIMSNLGVPLFRKGRFQDKCAEFYYLETLRSLSLGEDSVVFGELTKTDVAMSQYKDGPAIGHEVIRILTGKAIEKGVELPDNWLKIVLNIAGDPRVPPSSSSYRIWWSQLEQECTDCVLRVLSRFDLKLFLEALDEFAQRNNNYELERMFPARKKFLEGLFDLNLVGKTRLFIGRGAKSFLQSTYNAKELPLFANLKDANKSIIYLQVGHLHMIEGSHNSYLWIYDKLPESNLLNYSINEFAVRELGMSMREQYKDQFGIATSFPHRITHNPHGLGWQRRAIQAFHEQGIQIQPEKVFSTDDYLYYKIHHGLD